ncbi:g9623 [Coccomyxa elongata]
MPSMIEKAALGPGEPPSEKRNVLVVDDLYLNRIVLGKLLASFGFVVTYSSDGQEAVNTFQKRKESNEDFYAILMDVNMPTMDGLVATKHIRTIEAASTTQSTSSREPSGSCSSDSTTEAVGWQQPIRRVPIVGVSACSSTDQLKSKALDGLQLDPATDRPWAAVGMDLFMEKPVNRDKLRAMLDLLESDSWQRGDTAAESGQPPLQRARLQPLPGLGFAGGQHCNSLSSFSGGLDIKVSSRPGGEQVTKRGLGACMQFAAEEQGAKRARAMCSSEAAEASPTAVGENVAALAEAAT